MSREHPRANCDTINAEMVRSLLHAVIEREKWGHLSEFQRGRNLADAISKKTKEAVSGKTVQRILKESTPTRDVLHANRLTLEKYFDLNPGDLLVQRKGTDPNTPAEPGTAPDVNGGTHPIDSVATISPYLEPAHPGFFGRTAELALLNGAIETGRPSIVVLTGGGGSGKTTIAYQMRERWLSAGWRLPDSRCIASWFEWSFSSQAEPQARESSAAFLQKATEHFARRGNEVRPEDRTDPSRWGSALSRSAEVFTIMRRARSHRPRCRPSGALGVASARGTSARRNTPRRRWSGTGGWRRLGASVPATGGPPG